MRAFAAGSSGRGLLTARSAASPSDVQAAQQKPEQQKLPPTSFQPNGALDLALMAWRVIGHVIDPSRLPWKVVGHTATVVDCGSGSTRSIDFSEAAEGLNFQKSEWRGTALADALLCPQKSEELLDLLQEKLPRQGRVLLGATAGLRRAIEVGRVRDDQVAGFRCELRRRLGERASLEVLSGEEEARAEWKAVCHKRSATDPELHGMISGGGMSCQLAFGSSDEGGHTEGEQFFSFTNGVLQPGGLVDRAAQGSLLARDLSGEMARHEAAIQEAVSKLPTCRSGSFAMIEWAGNFVAGKSSQNDLRMGLGHERFLSRNAVLEAIDQHAAGMWPADPRTKVQRRVAVALLYCTVMRTMLRHVFSEDAQFYGMSNVNWATGHYLLSKPQATGRVNPFAQAARHPEVVL